MPVLPNNTLVGAEVIQQLEPAEEAIVSFLWPDRNTGRMAICHMAWMPQWTVKRYLHEQPLKSQPLLGLWMTAKAYNRKREKVKLNYVPPPGDAIVMQRVSRKD